jgi:23S rRNA (guanosine2251-2'-O)-methyltransferase
MNLICGINPVLEALQAEARHFDRLLIVKGLRSKRLSEAIRRATKLAVPLRFEMRETLDRMAGGVAHQGIIAIVSEKPVLSLESLLESAREPALVVVLDGVEDPRNLGAILRTAEAAGADGVMLPERHSAGLSETVARASAGAIEHVKVARVGNLVQALQALKARGIWVVGFDAAGSERWDAVDLTKPVALVLGGEGRGIRRLVREHCDHLVSIPHFGHIGSLNVSVAAGIALYEVVRQRRSVPSGVRPIPARPQSPQIVGPAPDDAENDPGARPAPLLAGDDATGDGSSEIAAASVRHVDLSDDVAWGQGPVILKSVGFDRPHRDDDRRRKGRRHRPPGQERRGPPPAAAGNDRDGREGRDGRDGREGQQEGAPQRKGRRRRRRGHRDGVPVAGSPPPAATSRGPESAGGGAPERPPGPDGAPPEGGGRKRRRRRRRH